MRSLPVNWPERLRPAAVGRLLVLLLALYAISLLAIPGSSAASVGRGAAAVGPPPGVSVLGSQLVKDGVPWLPRGVQIVGLVAPDGALSGKYVDAHAHFGIGELRQAVADGADLVRFQVSQFGLDPDNRLYSPAYVSEIQSAVAMARSLGLAVIVSVQAEPPAGENTRCPLPDDGTARVWAELAQMFATDPYVMFELYNEPALGANAGNWLLWLDGGELTEGNGETCQAVGVQSLIDEIRAEQAPNVIIVPGLHSEQTLSGMPIPTDPANPFNPQLAYGIHYPSLNGGINQWNKEFGRLSVRVPVIITEWDQNSLRGCSANTPAGSTLLLDYLISKKIGIVGFAFDLPGTIIADWSYAPTTFTSFACGVPGGGPGQLLFNEFTGLAQADGPKEVIDAPAWIVSASALATLEQLAPAAASHFFDTPRTFVTGAVASTVQAAPAALPTVKFTSETALAAAIDDDLLPAGTRAVMFEDEHSKLTPRVEQLHPGTYYRRAAQIAHHAGLLLIAAPDASLVYAHAPHLKASQQDAKFLKLRIARSVAPYADVYDIDAQSTETHPLAYRAFVQKVIAQATAGHPGIELVAGLTTNLQGRKQASKTLLTAALATRTVLAGFNLNDPGSTRIRPGRPAWYPSAAAAFLRGLRNQGG